ncbi:MAG: 1,4-dihydroxy-6-naphthoate synthase [Bacteroidales bacterium]|jgi:1,4-dihydroxy-6-naphthoate synthase|nr:1,4-dihydroxy-6-naphthoate synthase [Bacteroidales bacterium]
MKLTLGFSPCPNDTFIFDAMVHGRIDTEGLEFEYYLADVEELNRKAFTGEPDITKMSFYAYAFAAQNYLILDSGSALGHRNGPLLISKKISNPSMLKDASIAIPGKYTTANMLFSIAWPDALNKTEYHFSDIERALLHDEVDAGLIIHETRFTYAKKGLKKIADMGEYWEKLTGFPIPLGTIVINRRIPEETALKVNRIIRRSLEYAYHDSLASYDFVVTNAKEMEKTVMNRHIKLYVNKFTLNLGKGGKRAINELYRIAGGRGIIPPMPGQIFLNSH